MAKIKRRGTSGAAKAYVTRTHAVRKLQVSLADFRRLCILKGIFPREPKSRKKANKGNSAPASFYHTKDIVYLQHEPVLRKLREHKAFAKKLARAVGRQEWVDAESLERQEPKYRLDHVIKERYPTFIDAVRDIDDALCLVHLFALLPSNDRIQPDIVENCARLAAEWQLYVMRARALRKVFLSIKGIYFQAEVMGQTVTWLVPYLFTQHVPVDVDFRIMLTFLELYQTLLGFVLFKLYTDLNLVYPPPLDVDKDAAGAGVGAFLLKESADALPLPAETAVPEARKVSAKDVRRAIQSIPAPAPAPATDMAVDPAALPAAEPMQEDAADEAFVEQPSTSTSLPTLGETNDSSPTAIAPAPATTLNTSLFAPYVIFLSREVTRPVFEFLIRAFGGRVGWAPTLGAGSPYAEASPEITHVVMDRPSVPAAALALHKARKYVQPQWVADCVNTGRVLLEAPYAPGQTLPPHLSPFVDEERTRELGGYVPEEAGGERAVRLEGEDAEEDEEDEEEEESEEEEEEEEVVGSVAKAKPGTTEKLPSITKSKTPALPPALQAAALDPSDASLQRAAELEAEASGVSYADFQAALKAATRRGAASAPAQLRKRGRREDEEGMPQIMMTNKKRKLYEKMKFGNERKTEERERLERKKELLRKEERKKAGKV